MYLCWNNYIHCPINLVKNLSKHFFLAPMHVDQLMHISYNNVSMVYLSHFLQNFLSCKNHMISFFQSWRGNEIMSCVISLVTNVYLFIRLQVWARVSRGRLAFLSTTVVETSLSRVCRPMCRGWRSTAASWSSSQCTPTRSPERVTLL